MAMLFGALLILGVSPGPQLVDERPDVFWGVINSMYIGNIMLLILSIPLDTIGSDDEPEEPDEPPTTGAGSLDDPTSWGNE